MSSSSEYAPNYASRCITLNEEFFARDSFVFRVFVLNEAFTASRGVIERFANMWSAWRFALLANEWRALMTTVHYY